MIPLEDSAAREARINTILDADLQAADALPFGSRLNDCGMSSSPSLGGIRGGSSCFRSGLIQCRQRRATCRPHSGPSFGDLVF
jgi:hypothetical protein